MPSGFFEAGRLLRIEAITERRPIIGGHYVRVRADDGRYYAFWRDKVSGVWFLDAGITG